MTSDPQDAGSPTSPAGRGTRSGRSAPTSSCPVHFHIGASLTAINFYGQYFWPSLHDNIKPAVGGSMLFLNNARVVINSIYAGIFDRHPKLKMVSVESGIGWIPFILETMDYELLENAPAQAAELSRMPSEYFKDHWYATFWFERNHGDLQGLIDSVGEDNVMFETRLPAPHLPVPEPARHGGGDHAHPATGDPAQGPRRERRHALPPLTSPSPNERGPPTLLARVFR